jgi:hypothetical protein
MPSYADRTRSESAAGVLGRLDARSHCRTEAAAERMTNLHAEGRVGPMKSVSWSLPPLPPDALTTESARMLLRLIESAVQRRHASREEGGAGSATGHRSEDDTAMPPQ